MLRAAAIAERAGVPSVSIVTTTFMQQAAVVSKGVGLPSLPIAEYPEITPPTIRVTANYPGANAQVVADTVAAPIEQQVKNQIREREHHPDQRRRHDSAFD